MTPTKTPPAQTGDVVLAMQNIAPTTPRGNKTDIYIVWNPEGDAPPKLTHTTHKQAHLAACAMAARHPGHHFYVMRRQGRGALTVVPESASASSNSYADYLADMKAQASREAFEHEDQIRQRLVTMYSHRGDGIPTQFVNPDGRAALALIDHYAARAKKAEAALERQATPC